MICILIFALILTIVILGICCSKRTCECETRKLTISDDEKKRLSEPTNPELIFNTDELMGFFSE